MVLGELALSINPHAVQNRDRTTRKTIRVAAARAVRVNVRLDAIEIPRETSSFPLALRLANYNKI